MHNKPKNSLQGLALSRSERIIVVALSYVWCTPLFVWFGGRLWHYLKALRNTNNNSTNNNLPPGRDNRQR